MFEFDCKNKLGDLWSASLVNSVHNFF